MIESSRTLEQYRTKGVLVDANLLLLLVLGDIDRSYIKKCKRTSEYSPADYEVLDELVKFFGGRVATTPNILTEVSNLANALKYEPRAGFFDRFAEVIPELIETYIPSDEASALPRFDHFGLTDLGILQLAKERYLVVTADGRLADYLGHQGVDVLAFSVIRAMSWR